MTTPIEISNETTACAEACYSFRQSHAPIEAMENCIQLAINSALAEKDRRIAELENRITKEIRSHAATIKDRDEESDELRAQLTNARAAIVEKDKALKLASNFIAFGGEKSSVETELKIASALSNTAGQPLLERLQLMENALKAFHEDCVQRGICYPENKCAACFTLNL